MGRLKRRNREPVRDVRKNDGARSAIATHTRAAELKPKKTLNPPLESDRSNNLVAVQGKRAER